MHDLRNEIREHVAQRRPVDAKERESQRLFLELFDGLKHPFDERGDRVHVTASAVVLSERGVVLHLHKRLQRWLQPGGHIEAGETPWGAARREAIEETGLPINEVEGVPPLLHVDVHPGPRGHRHLDLRYLFTSPYVVPSPPPGESPDVKWFQWHHAIGMAEAGLEGVLRILQPGQPVLRAARASDAPDCARVYLRSRAFGLPLVPSVHSDSEVRRWMADEVIGHLDVTVAEVDGVIVGLMATERATKAGSGWIEQLYVDPSWIGRSLGDRFIGAARKRFPDQLELWTFEANGAASRFYERHGFVAIERTDGRGNEERAPDIRYCWTP